MTWLSAIVSGLKALAIALGWMKQESDQTTGTKIQQAATDEATLDTIKRVNAPIAPAESDELWNANKKRFGAPDGDASKAK